MHHDNRTVNRAITIIGVTVLQETGIVNLNIAVSETVNGHCLITNPPADPTSLSCLVDCIYQCDLKKSRDIQFAETGEVWARMITSGSVALVADWKRACYRARRKQGLDS